MVREEGACPLVEELDQGHRRIIPATVIHLDHAGVAAALVRLGALQIARGDVGEELVNEVDLFHRAIGIGLGELLREEARDLPAGVKAAREDALALGPMAVLPSHQNRGIGTRLVRDGLEACRGRGAPLVFVLGHPGFYPRFGFVPP